MLTFRVLALCRSEMANARNVSTSFLPYGGITYLINSFDYPNFNYCVSIPHLRSTSFLRNYSHYVLSTLSRHHKTTEIVFSSKVVVLFCHYVLLKKNCTYA